jgi:hypothetical protein
MNRLLALLVGLWGCSHANAADSIRMTVEGPMGMVPGDTIAYSISWTAPVVVAGVSGAATSYTLTLTASATNGVWSVVADSNLVAGKWTTGSGTGPMPTNINVTTLYVKSWLSAIPWDSATFTASLVARNAAGTSSPATATWKVAHKRLPPGTPGTPTIDSSVTVTGMLVFPQTNSLLLGSSRTLCSFQQFSSGAVTEWTADKASCDSLYTKYVSSAARGLVTPAQQAHTDSLTKTCVSWTSTLPLAVPVTPNATCSSAATIRGLQLTQRFPIDRPTIRDVGFSDEPVIRVVPNEKGALVTCLRPGIAYLKATTTAGLVGLKQIVCAGRPEALAMYAVR